MTTFNGQVTRLSGLQPSAAVAANFHAAVADGTALAGMLRSLLARPDYAHSRSRVDSSRPDAELAQGLDRAHTRALVRRPEPV